MSQVAYAVVLSMGHFKRWLYYMLTFMFDVGLSHDSLFIKTLFLSSSSFFLISSLLFIQVQALRQVWFSPVCELSNIILLRHKGASWLSKIDWLQIDMEKDTL